jgi:hypothetical protein
MPAMKLAIATLLLIVAAAAARAQSHPCAADAIAKATLLLRFHYGEPNEPVDVANRTDAHAALLTPPPHWPCKDRTKSGGQSWRSS